MKARSITCEPGNGTRYRLVLVTDPDGGWLVIWRDARWLGWFDDRTGRVSKTLAGKIGKIDLLAISDIVAVELEMVTR